MRMGSGGESEGRDGGGRLRGVKKGTFLRLVSAPILPALKIIK